MGHTIGGFTIIIPIKKYINIQRGCSAVWLCYFEGSFGVVFAICAVW